MKRGTPNEPKFIDPKNTLKIKVGHGGIPPANLKKSQQIIGQNNIDFVPIATGYLEQIEHNLNKLNDHPSLKKDKLFLDKFAQPVMGLKANGGMFQYTLVSMIADVGLIFLDKAGELNEDGREIIKAHNTSIKMILQARLKGSVGREGRQIVDELQDACTRYYKKHGKN